MGQQRTKNEYTYEKVLICLYPHADWLVGQMRQSVMNKAVLSHRSTVEPEKLAAALLQEEYYCDELEEGMKLVGKAFLSLNDLEWALVQYRCWNRSEDLRRYLQGEHVLSAKTLLRRYNGGVKKIAGVLHRNGIDFNWFKRIILHYDWGQKVYRKVASVKFNKRKLARAGKSPFGHQTAGGEKSAIG